MAVDGAVDMPSADLPAADPVAVDAPMTDLSADTNEHYVSDTNHDSEEVDLSGQDAAKDVAKALGWINCRTNPSVSAWPLL